MSSHSLASYMSLYCANVLHDLLPSLPLVLLPTCNKLNRVESEQIWGELLRNFAMCFRGVLDFNGFSSDGDSRRFSLQQQVMTNTNGNRFSCKSDFFRHYTAPILSDGLVRADNQKSCSLHLLSCLGFLWLEVIMQAGLT